MFIDPEFKYRPDERKRNSWEVDSSRSSGDNSGYGALIIGGVIVVCALGLWLLHFVH